VLVSFFGGLADTFGRFPILDINSKTYSEDKGAYRGTFLDTYWYDFDSSTPSSDGRLYGADRHDEQTLSVEGEN